MPAIVTYFSRNSRPEVAWLAYIELGGKHLGIRFTGADEESVKAKVREFWKAEREKVKARPALPPRRNASVTQETPDMKVETQS